MKKKMILRLGLFVAPLAVAAVTGCSPAQPVPDQAQATSVSHPKIQVIDPPENGFFTKELSFHGILIKAPTVVADEALYVVYDRMARETMHLPMVVTNLAAAGAQVHLIGRDQVTTDLPEWRQDKHVPLDEYNGLTRDERTRGMGGLITSCAEENLLNLPTDRYRGRDICMHEFAHNIENHGIPREVRAIFDKQFDISKSKGLWIHSYAGSNTDEYFAELTMWYFGTHGDLGMTGPKPANGPEGLKNYDPDAYALLDNFYNGKIDVAKVEPRLNTDEDEENRRAPHDSLAARAIVAHLSSYKPGETTLAVFQADAGMAKPSDSGVNGWYVAEEGDPADYRFRVFFRNSAAPGGRDRLIAALEFKSGVLTAFKWDN